MALFGRENQADQRRAERVGQWVRARSGFALIGGLLSLMAVIDFFTPLGPILGLTSVVLGVRGLNQIRRRPELLGRRLAWMGIVFGSLGFLASTTMWVALYQRRG